MRTRYGKEKKKDKTISVLHKTTRKQVKIVGNILKMKFQIPIIRTLYVAYEFYSALRGKKLCDCLKLGKKKYKMTQKNMWCLMMLFAIRCLTGCY